MARSTYSQEGCTASSSLILGVTAAVVKRDDGSYLISGWMSAVEFASLLRYELPPSRHYQTVAGFLLSHFGRIPDVGDQIEVEGWRFEVLDLDGRRIDKVLATKVAAVVGDT